MNTTVVCGLLGSGKTTFIRNILRNAQEKTVVLVNDFGSSGIDGEILSAGGIDAVELPSGCVCCTLKVDLITTIQRIVKEFSPQRLMIEPSGVASPSAVLEALDSAGIGGASVVGIIDAAEFAELYESGMYGSFFKDQIENSDIILVNKIDLAEEALIAAAEQLIGSINPLAVLVRSLNAEINITLPESARHRAIQPSNRHFHFETISFRMRAKIDFAAISRVFNDIAGGIYGTVARIKALINTSDGPYYFDCAYGKVVRRRFEKDITDSRMVIIGEMMDRQAMERALFPCG
jgi:G3E family GTPase